MKLLPGFLVALSFPLIACSDGPDDNNDVVDCDDEPRADVYAAGMSKLGDSGVEFVLVSSDPTPPDRGDNNWTLQVLESAAPTDGLILDVVPFMPDHGHGTPKIAEIEPVGSDGMYEVTTVNLWMPGLWEVTVSASDTGGLIDSAVFAFCIDG
jgi:hypothetical protein